MKNNGQQFGPRSKQPPKQTAELRIVYGAKCTWWGNRTDAKPIMAGLINPRCRGNASAKIPRCPECLGPLMEVPNEESFWLMVKRFEDGGRGVARPHPGYVDFMKWMRRRCFKNVMLAQEAYLSQTGITIELDPEDFN